MSVKGPNTSVDESGKTGGIAVLLILFHICLAVGFVAIGLGIGAFFPILSLTQEHAFLIGASLLCVAWGLFRKRPWVIVPQIAALVGAGLTWQAYQASRMPYQAGWDYGMALLVFWMQMLAMLVLGFGTAIFQASAFLNAAADDPDRDWRNWIVEAIALLLIAAGIVAGGDYVLPAYRAGQEAPRAEERKAAQEAVQKRNESLVDATFRNLESAVRGEDAAATKGAIHQVRDAPYGEYWKKSLHAASREAQLALLREMNYFELSSLLEEPEIDPEVRHRLVVITMKEHGGGPVRKMGALRSVSTHPHLVCLVADAISDREIISIEDRVRLAEVLEEIAGLPDFDPQPAIASLEQVIATDDPRIAEAAKKALAAIRSRQMAVP